MYLQVGLSGMNHCKVIPEHMMDSPLRVVQAAAIAMLPWGITCPGADAGVSGELHLVPVKQSIENEAKRNIFRKQPSSPLCLPRELALPWHPNHKFAISKMVTSDGNPWPKCTKSTLIAAVELLKEKGLNVKAGFELEFVLFTEDAESDEKSFFGRTGQYAHHDQFDMCATFIDDLIICLQQMNIIVTLTHAEGGPGQFEIVLQHKDILEATHDLIIARMAVKAIARKHNFIATFVPSCGENLAGSGSHVHLSLEGHFQTYDEVQGLKMGVSQTGQSFMAGILNALPWLMFLLNSSPLSYARSQPQYWVGVYQVWGDNNKEAPIRLVEDRSNFEVKLLDAVSNADLALAGLLLAGLKGIEENASLPEPCQVDPHTIDAEKRPPLLPLSLQKSLQAFKDAYEDGQVHKLVNEDLVHDLLILKQVEIDYVESNGLGAYRDLLMKLH